MFVANTRFDFENEYKAHKVIVIINQNTYLCVFILKILIIIFFFIDFWFVFALSGVGN